MAVFPMCFLDNRDLDCFAAEMAKLPESEREKYLDHLLIPIPLVNTVIYRPEQVEYIRAKAKEFADPCIDLFALRGLSVMSENFEI